MTIFIGNYRKGPVLHDIPHFDCSRRSPVGNPYPMQGEAQRDQVCDRYVNWFMDQIVEQKNTRFLHYLDQIIASATVQDIRLMCWCAPKRCHCETIRKHVEREL